MTGDWSRVEDMLPGPDSPTLEPEIHAAMRRWMKTKPVYREDLSPGMMRQFDEIARATWTCEVSLCKLFASGKALLLFEPRSGEGFPYIAMIEETTH